METFKLYGTSACHLCEIAESMLVQQCDVRDECTFEKVDIAESDALFACYGLMIPVLAHPDGAELKWPFSVAQLQAFLDR